MQEPVTNVPITPPHTSAPLPPDSDDTLIQDLPAPIPDLLVPPDHFPESIESSPSQTNPGAQPRAGSPLLQDALFEQDTEALELELQSLELEPDDQDFNE